MSQTNYVKAKKKFDINSLFIICGDYVYEKYQEYTRKGQYQLKLDGTEF